MTEGGHVVFWAASLPLVSCLDLGLSGQTSCQCKVSKVRVPSSPRFGLCHFKWTPLWTFLVIRLGSPDNHNCFRAPTVAAGADSLQGFRFPHTFHKKVQSWTIPSPRTLCQTLNNGWLEQVRSRSTGHGVCGVVCVELAGDVLYQVATNLPFWKWIRKLFSPEIVFTFAKAKQVLTTHLEEGAAGIWQIRLTPWLCCLLTCLGSHSSFVYALVLAGKMECCCLHMQSVSLHRVVFGHLWMFDRVTWRKISLDLSSVELNNNQRAILQRI